MEMLQSLDARENTVSGNLILDLDCVVKRRISVSLGSCYPIRDSHEPGR